MGFWQNALNFFGNFFSGIIDDIQRQVYYRTGQTGALGVILLLFKKWYLIVMIPAITALYWIIKGLDDIGVINSVEHLVVHQLNIVIDIAHYCTPKLFHREAFLECLNDPGK